MTLAQQMAAYPPTGIRNIKRSFNAALECSLESTLELEAEFDRECYRSVETWQTLRDFIKSHENQGRTDIIFSPLANINVIR